MKNLRLISTAAAILLLGAGAVSAQSMKADEMPARAPAAQQNVPAEKMAPALKSDQSKAPETTGQAAPKAPEADKKPPAAAATKSGVGAASPSSKSADEGKRSATDQGAVKKRVVAHPRHRHYRHYRHHRHRHYRHYRHRHYRHCWTNIFGYRSYRNCWY